MILTCVIHIRAWEADFDRVKKVRDFAYVKMKTAYLEYISTDNGKKPMKFMIAVTTEVGRRAGLSEPRGGILARMLG